MMIDSTAAKRGRATKNLEKFIGRCPGLGVADGAWEEGVL
jgi:hypothetical protein